jgi:hypothetical protein
VLSAIISARTHGNDGKGFGVVGSETRALSVYLHVRANIFKSMDLVAFASGSQTTCGQLNFQPVDGPCNFASAQSEHNFVSVKYLNAKGGRRRSVTASKGGPALIT